MGERDRPSERRLVRAETNLPTADASDKAKDRYECRKWATSRAGAPFATRSSVSPVVVRR